MPLTARHLTNFYERLVEDHKEIGARVDALEGQGGVQGPAGPQGPQGPQGVAGPTGNDGPQGPQGPAGADSVVPGPKGDAGNTGPQGPAGAQGPQGTAGADGAQGIQGPAGNDGAQGPQGIQGPQGDPGPNAAWGNITGTLSSQTDLNSALGGKAASSHTHAASDVTGTAVVTNDSRLSDARTPVSHTHAPADTTGTAVITTDGRLSDARTPLSHSHVAGDITGTAVLTNDARLSDARQLAAGADKTKLDGIAAGAQVNNISDVDATDLTDGGATTLHSHAGGGGQPIGFTILANDTLAQALATNINTRITVTAARTLTTTVPAAGTRCSVMVLTSGTTSFVITFGSGFKPVGTLATGTTTNRVFVVNFISNGTNLYEAGRTAAMAA